MKKITKIFGLLLISCFMLVPGITAKAATKPNKPTGLGVYSQDKSKIAVDFTFDSNLPNYSPENPYSCGYEITVTNTKGKKLQQRTLYMVNLNTSEKELLVVDNTTLGVILSGKQYTRSAFIFKVRSFVCDANNQPIYSETAEKLVVPRAVVTKIKATSRTTGKVSWNKISGAKKYTVYVSSNNGKKYKKAGSTKSKSFTIKNMKLGKTYYVYVVADGVKVGKKKYSSSKMKDKQGGVTKVSIYMRYR